MTIFATASPLRKKLLGVPSRLWQAALSSSAQRNIYSTEFSSLHCKELSLQLCSFSDDEEVLLLENISPKTQHFSFKTQTSTCLVCSLHGDITISTYNNDDNALSSQQSLIIKFTQNTQTAIKVGARAKVFILQLPHSRISGNLSFDGHNGLTKNVSYSTNLRILRSVEKIHMSAHEPARAKLFLFGVISRIYADLIHQEFSENIESIDSNIEEQNISVVRKAESILKKNIASPPNMESLVKKIGTNRNKLIKSFKSVHGLSIFEYCQRERMRLARYTLENKAFSVAQVAEAVGYRHPGNFSLAYKKYYGELPKRTQKKS